MSKYSVSKKRVPSSGVPSRWIAVALSQVTPTQRSPTPRMVKMPPPEKLPLVKVTLGSVSWRSLAFLICCFSSASALNAETAIGTSCRLSAWRCAVTMITSPGAEVASSAWPTVSPVLVSCAKAVPPIARASAEVVTPKRTKRPIA